MTFVKLMTAKTAEVVKCASAADIAARFAGDDWGEPHSGAMLAKSFIRGPFHSYVARSCEWPGGSGLLV